MGRSKSKSGESQKQYLQRCYEINNEDATPLIKFEIFVLIRVKMDYSTHAHHVVFFWRPITIIIIYVLC